MIRRLVPLCLLLVLAGAALAPWIPVAVSTPGYSARAGRTCDNCHLDPSYWENPEWKSRKCTLSCQGCHVDPAGGGMRNASGRFYGAATLPSIATQPRPTRDWDRDLFGLFHRMDRSTVYSDDLPRGPKTQEESTEYRPEDTWAFGGRDESHDQTLVQGRYGTLAADPKVRLGWDFRSAVLSSFTSYENTRTLVFPMQMDVGLVVHPVHHVVVLANIGARGRASGISETLEDVRTPYLRDAFLLITEFPYQAYVKAGRFVPSYGLRLDDHTAFIRKRTTVDTSIPDSRVLGIEVGAAPSYPFVNASWFKSKMSGVAPDAWNPLDTDETWGVALNTGYRELTWAVGVSALYRDAYVGLGRNLSAFSGYGVWNLWNQWQSLPLTYQVEVDRVSQGRSSSGNQITHLLWQELNWTATNGINVLLGHSWEDPDREIGFDEANRLHLGVQFTPYPGVTLDLRLRRLWVRRAPERVLVSGTPSPHGTDVLFQIHLWN